MKTAFFFVALGVARPTVAAPLVNPLQSITTILKNIPTSLDNAFAAGDSDSILRSLQSVQPVQTPSSISQAASFVQAINNASTTNIYEYIALQRSLGLIDDINSLVGYVQGLQTGEGSSNNVNRDPTKPVYPQANAMDAPYSQAEKTLRGAIYIPPTFTYGAKPPVILVPGTGNTGYFTFKGNFIPLLTSVNWADPVWLNIPGFLWNDAQSNAEFVAYAINYIASVTTRNVTVLGWSQGNIDTQWAFKYWPSTRSVTSDHVSISADYDGTLLASFVFPPGVPAPPSLLQQRYLKQSNFITTLQKNGGDSAYVPTTTVYSGFFDEIVEPQQGTAASGYILDARSVGASNSQVQVVCPPGSPGGSFYTHEGVLYNPLAYALLKDAMANAGPGRTNRLNVPQLCGGYLTAGLNLGDFLLTENAIAVSGISLLLYQPKVITEPPIRAYATRG